jgi:hypothetical protein
LGRLFARSDNVTRILSDLYFFFGGFHLLFSVYM